MFRVDCRVCKIPPIFGIVTDRSNVDHHRTSLVFNSSTSSINFCTCCCSSSSSSSLSLQLGCCSSRSRLINKSNCSNNNKLKTIISCKASSSGNNSRRRSGFGDDYVQAFLLYSETIRHYQLRKQGFVEETKLSPFSTQAQYFTPNTTTGHGFLRRFQNPTVFLKIACDGDLLLPIAVGDSAIQNLIDVSREDENADLPSQFQLIKNLGLKLGYEILMVRITERVVNTYYAKIFFRKPGEKIVLSVDARPSDAINVAKRCKVPIFINKQIVLTDATKIVYGARRRSYSKTAYDVYLDSAAEGPDLLSEELDLLKNMNLAVKEERYKDAALMKFKLTKLRSSGL
ncbi:bifunctional nuclease 2-like [Papaver somniferum]|uniref:bifunctional nuclease 2-like n=1 Tax=Papaver somniferum TaxID=3469 RepID=UPI000E6F8EA0|nr:bifunctional nuclease 2-like [Papaver somniferum]